MTKNSFDGLRWFKQEDKCQNVQEMFKIATYV